MRITKTYAQEVAGKIAEERFGEARKNAYSRRKYAGNYVYNVILGGCMDFIASLQEGWYKEVSDFFIPMSLIDTTHTRGDTLQFLLTSSRRVPLDGYIRFIPEGVSMARLTEVISDYRTIDREIDSLISQQRNLKRELTSFFTTFTTVKKLLEVSPELESYFTVNVPEKSKAPVPCKTYSQIMESYQESRVKT